MRKLLILMLVLGMASMANAALSLVVNGVEVGADYTLYNTSDTIWIGVYDDTGNTQYDRGIVLTEETPGVAEAGGSWTGGYAYYAPPAVPAGYTFPLGYITGIGDVWYLVDSEPTANMTAIGLQAEYEFHCDVLFDDVVINLTDTTLVNMIDTITIHQIPEPMTMVLLGLGGLLLRRRK